MPCGSVESISRRFVERTPGHFGCGVLETMNAKPLSAPYATIAEVRAQFGEPELRLFCPVDLRARNAHREAGAVVFVPRPLDPQRNPAVANTLIRDAMRALWARCPTRGFGPPSMAFVQLAAPAGPGGPAEAVGEVRNYGLGLWFQTIWGSQARASVRLRDLPGTTPVQADPVATDVPTVTSPPSALRRPVAGEGVNSPFFDPAYAAEENRQHLGADLTAPAETPVVSPVAGTVTHNYTSGRSAETAFLILRERDGGRHHVLGHFRSNIPPGVTVTAGQPLGTVLLWMSDDRDRSHLHWGVSTRAISPSVRTVRGGDWGWGRAPASATRAQAEAEGWLDPLSLLTGGVPAVIAATPGNVEGLRALDARTAVDVWTTNVYPRGRPAGRNDHELRVGGWGDRYLTLIRFPTVEEDANVTLELYDAGDEGRPVDMTVMAVLEAWAVPADGRLQWSALPRVLIDDQTIVPVGEQRGWVSIDITNFNDMWRSGRLANNGLSIGPIRTDNRFNEFVSSESPQVDLRPRLRIAPRSGSQAPPLGDLLAVMPGDPPGAAAILSAVDRGILRQDDSIESREPVRVRGDWALVRLLGNIAYDHWMRRGAGGVWRTTCHSGGGDVPTWNDFRARCPTVPRPVFEALFLSDEVE